MSNFWSLYISGLTLLVIFGVTWLLFANRRKVRPENDHLDAEKALDNTLGHDYDGIDECDNPLPFWWFVLFVLSIVAALIYLLLYPGLGAWQGLLGWSQEKQWQQQVIRAEQKYQPIFEEYAKIPVNQLVGNPAAVKIGHRLFSNHCAVCHGADARGYLGFPNLVDNDWLYGGDPQTLTQTLLHGRQGNMPAWNQLGEQGMLDVTGYVRSLSGMRTAGADINVGEMLYQKNCVACHGVDGKGNQQLGAPNLTDDIWLYGGRTDQVLYSLRNGRQGQMPAQKDRLTEEQIHLLVTYVLANFLDNMIEQADHQSAAE